MIESYLFIDKRPKNGWPHLFFGLFFMFAMTDCGKEKISINMVELSTPTKFDLTSIAFFDEKIGYAVGGQTWDRGEILSTTDGGDHWQLDTVTDQKLWDISFDTFGEAYSVGVGGQLWIKKLGSPSWEHVRQDWFFSRSASFLNEKQGLVASGEGFVNGKIQRLGPGEVWQMDSRDTFSQELAAVQWLDSLNAVACGYGLIIRSSDSGFSWERLSAEGDFFTALHFPTASIGYVVGKFGSILKSSDAGKSWEKLRKGGRAGKKAEHFNAVFFQNETVGYTVGDDGLFWKTTDGGDHWQAIEAPNDLDFTDIFIKNKTGWLAATDGRVFRFLAE